MQSPDGESFLEIKVNKTSSLWYSDVARENLKESLLGARPGHLSAHWG